MRLAECKAKQLILFKPPQHQQRRERGGNVGRDGDSGDAHVKRDHEKQIEPDICSAREHQCEERSTAVAARPQDGCAEVVQQQKQIAEHIEPQVKRRFLKNAVRRLDELKQRRRGSLSQKKSRHTDQSGQKHRRLYRGGQFINLILPDAVRDQNVRADGQTRGQRDDRASPATGNGHHDRCVLPVYHVR